MRGDWFNNAYSGRWSDRCAPSEWPFCSPDLIHLDFFTLGYVKSKVYATESIGDLKEKCIQSYLPR